MRRNFLIVAGILFIPLYLSSQSRRTDRVFVNTGEMSVGTPSAVSDTVLTVLGSMVTTKAAVTNQKAVTTLTGSFYHNATTNAFTVVTNHYPASIDNTWGTSTGTLVFKGGDPADPEGRFITSDSIHASIPANRFDRSAHFVAFPHIKIATNDTLIVPPLMGLDAETVLSNSGVMLLKSGTVGGKVYDASLRISNGVLVPNSKPAADVVSPGKVLIERDLEPYRDVSQPLFAFATPMDTMRSGYFAGNWVRKMVTSGSNKHVQFPLGNTPFPAGSTVISLDQYLRNPQTDRFQQGEAYIIKARPAGFDYSDLKDLGGLAVTDADASLYNQGKFLFNGKPYTLPTVAEQVFVNDKLFEHTLVEGLANTVNWVIGNSWTSAVSVDALRKLILDHPYIWFEQKIYVFPAGADGYYQYRFNDSSAGIGLIPDLEEIPSQSIFMIRVLSDAQAVSSGAGAGYHQHGTFSLDKKFLEVHSTASHNTLRAAQPNFINETLFTLTPESNPNLYALAAVGLRPNAKTIFESQDLEKIYSAGSESFTMYSLSTDGEKLAVNAVPPGTPSVKLCVEPGNVENRLTLTASRMESIDYIWLEDLLTQQKINLKVENSYTFDSSPQDMPDRFIVHFTAPSFTDIQAIRDNFLQAYYSRGELVIKGLLESDRGETVFITDTQGRILKKEQINQVPEMHIPVSFVNGVYIAKLQGKRTATVKFIKGGNL
jgi:hypothetical protein